MDETSLPLLPWLLIVCSLAAVAWQIRNNPRKRLERAVMGGEPAIVQELLEQGVPPDSHVHGKATPLYRASRDGDLAIVDLLLRYGADVNQGLKETHGMNPLLAAAINHHAAVTQRLLDQGAQIGLHYAAYTGDTERVYALLDQGQDINQMLNRGLSPLHLACLTANLALVAILLDRGATINLCTPAGESPLHKAVESNDPSLLKVLVEQGADLNLVSARGTPLHLAIWRNAPQMAQGLLALGADVNAQTAGLLSPLHTAAREGHEQLVALLLQNQAQVNLQSQCDRKLPLHLAARQGHLQAAQHLLEHGAQVNARSNFGITPLGEARAFPAMMALLISYGATDYGTSD